MESAFGIEHPGSEISKANPINAARKAKQVQNGYSTGKAVRKGPGKLKRLGERVVNADISLARVGTGLGSGIGTTGRKVGETIQRYPGTTGTLAVGGASYGLYRSGRNKKKVQGQA